MALTPADIRERIRRGLGVTQARAEQIFSRLVPTVDVAELLGDAASDAFAYRFCSAFGTLGASAGNFSLWQLRNPANSGVLAIITRVRGRSGSGDGVLLSNSITTAGFTQGNVAAFRDFRMKGTPACDLWFHQKATQDATSQLTAIWVRLASAQLETQIRDPIAVIDEGDLIQIGDSTQNSQVDISIDWIEIARGSDDTV